MISVNSQVEDHILESLYLLKRNLPKVLLFYGNDSIDKTSTALKFIDSLTHSGIFERHTNHPDIYIAKPESNTFKLELLDKVKTLSRQTPFELKNKYFILEDAHLMNRETSNASLKILEDCPSYCYFILTTTNLNKISDTLKSRSTLIEFYKDSESTKNDEECSEDYNLIYDLLNSIDSMSYSEVLEMSSKLHDKDPKYLVKIIYDVMSKFIYNNSKDYFFLNILNNEFNNLNIKSEVRLNFKIHFRYFFISLRRKIFKIH